MSTSAALGRGYTRPMPDKPDLPLPPPPPEGARREALRITLEPHPEFLEALRKGWKMVPAKSKKDEE